MSDLPFGLSADPFALPATLTPEQSARLIENRVRACGGDADALFPAETCAEIHRHAHGVTGAVCDLAGKAMRLAATAGAASVSPEHVRAAAAPTADGGEQAVVAEMPGAAEAPVAAVDTAPAANAALPSKNPVAVPDDIATADAEPEHVAPREVATDDAPAPDVAVEHVARAGAVSADALPDDIPDLPAATEGGIALPTEPSKDLAPDAQAWVSRFMSGEGAGARIKAVPRASRPQEAQGAPVAKAPAASAPAKALEAPRASSAPARAPQATAPPASVPHAAAPPSPRVQVERRRSPESSLPPGSKRPDRRVSRNIPRATPRGRGRRWWNETTSRIAAAAVIVLVGVIVAYRLRIETGRLVAARSAVPAPAAFPSDSAPPVTPQTARTASRTSRVPVTVGTRRVSGPPGQPTTVAPAPQPQVVAPAEPRGRFGIEVAAYIFPDRAEAERARLAAAVGERVRVVTEWENGAPTYRVVLGPYVSRAAADRAADTVLQAGLVQQARVVNVPRDR